MTEYLVKPIIQKYTSKTGEFLNENLFLKIQIE